MELLKKYYDMEEEDFLSAEDVYKRQLLPWHEDLLQSHGAFTEEDL